MQQFIFSFYFLYFEDLLVSYATRVLLNGSLLGGLVVASRAVDMNASAVEAVLS